MPCSAVAPGTALYDNLEKYGSVSENLAERTYQSAAFVPYTMTRDEILKLRQIAFRRFYTRPKFVLRRLLHRRSRHDLRANLHGLRSMCRLWSTRNLLHGRKDKVVTHEIAEQ